MSKKEEEEKKHTSYGKVPKYLEKINQKWEDEAAKVRAAFEDKDCPPGCMWMSEEEWLQTLDALHQNWAEIITMLEKMPISMRT